MEEENEILEYNCTNCGTKVNREDTKCPNCGAELEGFDDKDNDITVEIKTYANELDAGFDKSLLESEGIECFLEDTNIASLRYIPFALRLIVMKKDAKRALEILGNNDLK